MKKLLIGIPVLASVIGIVLLLFYLLAGYGHAVGMAILAACAIMLAYIFGDMVVYFLERRERRKSWVENTEAEI